MLLSRLPQNWQQIQRQEESPNNINRNCTLHPLHLLIVAAHNPCILNHDIQSLQFCGPLANSFTESKFPISIGHTSHAPFRPVLSSIDRAASSPLGIDRHARITLLAFRRAKCRAASRPSPMLLPVTIMVWPTKECVGYGIEVHCVLRNSISEKFQLLCYR
jgi:hypothetical protein